jgi:hypothetical protein
MTDGAGPRTTLDLPSCALQRHPRSTVTALGFVAATLAGLAACSSGGSSGEGQAGSAATAGSNGVAGAAIAGTAGSVGGHNQSGTAGASAAASGAGGTAGAGGANPIGGSGGSSVAGTQSETGGGGSAGAGGAPGDAGALEAVSVPAGGAVKTSTMNLDSGALFLLKAVGALKAGTGGDNQYGDLDAEYGGITAGGTGQDVVAGVDVGIDVGFKFERMLPGTTPGRKKWFGPYRSDHTYYVIVTGVGAPLSLKTIQPPSSTATGAITVSIFRLSPTPTPTPVMLDSFNALLTKQVVHSNVTTAVSTVYLLKVSGEGKVGGNALALGDADYMDYAQNGNGKVDVGDGNVDYGLGVDELDTKVTPRQHWWGSWRLDHTYFMLFAGTGSPIGFMYYDVGDYGDNSTTAMLPVQILKVP